jgi:hypothetical protein
VIPPVGSQNREEQRRGAAGPGRDGGLVGQHADAQRGHRPRRTDLQRPGVLTVDQ